MKKILLLIIAINLIACNKNLEVKSEYPVPPHEKNTSRFGSVLGEGGFILGGDSNRNSDPSIAVNRVLWQAALETISFMPIQTSDPISGLITTDWYQINENSNEKFKFNIIILGNEIRSDSLKVNVFKQKKVNNNWVNTEASKDFAIEIENKIFTKAKQNQLKNKF